jgi:hypothetical protein
MPDFTAVLDDNARDYFEAIVEVLTTHLGHTRDDAVEKINDWSGPRKVEPDDLVYHETPEFWACRLHYGRHDFWRYVPFREGIDPVYPWQKKPGSTGEI